MEPTSPPPSVSSASLPLRERFRNFANVTARAMGTPWAFVSSAAVVVVWAAAGPVYHFSDTWQLVINTGTTIVTFLMVFLIQATQNRDSQAIHMKLDELLRAIGKARNTLVGAENMSEDEIRALEQEFAVIKLKYAGRKAAKTK